MDCSRRLVEKCNALREVVALCVSSEFEDFDDALSFEGLPGRGILDCTEVIFVDPHGDWSS